MKARAEKPSSQPAMIHRKPFFSQRQSQAFFAGPRIQPKLTIGQPNDKYEQEADRVADQVMTMPHPTPQRQGKNELEYENIQTKPLADQITPLVQRQVEIPEEEEPVQAKLIDNNSPQRMCPECEEEIAQRQPEGGEEEELQTKTQSSDTLPATTGIESKINGMKGGGKPLDPATRNFFEPRFGYDFNQVRLHTSSSANETAQSINAQAFTIGQDVVFSEGKYAPQTQEGKKILGHELTHVVQQNGPLLKRLPSSRFGGISYKTGSFTNQQKESHNKITILQRNHSHPVAQPGPRNLSLAGTVHGVIQRGERWEQVKAVGPLDALRAKRDADKAIKAARKSGLPGLWNGPADAFRHAYWNCLMVKSIGYSQAETVARIHEKYGKNHANERNMDDFNNAKGRLAGAKRKGGSCIKRVWSLLKKGLLKIIPNYKAVSSSRGKIAPKRPVLYKPKSLPSATPATPKGSYY